MGFVCSIWNRVGVGFQTGNSPCYLAQNPRPSHPIKPLPFSADGRRFACIQEYTEKVKGQDEEKTKVTIYSLPDLKIVSPIIHLSASSIYLTRDLKGYWSLQKFESNYGLKRVNLLSHKAEAFFPYSGDTWQLSPDESLLALNIRKPVIRNRALDLNNYAIIYRVRDSRLVRVLPKSNDSLDRFTFSPDNSLIADTDDEGIGTRFFEFSTGKELWQLPLRSSDSPFVFSPDSRFVVANESDQLNVRDARTGKIVRDLPTPGIAENFSHLA